MMFSAIASFHVLHFFIGGWGWKKTWIFKFHVTGADSQLLLTAVCTTCRLQHTKARKESDFDDGEGAEKVSDIPNKGCRCCSSFDGNECQ